MARKKKRIDTEAILKLSGIFGALAIIFAPIIAFWNKFKLPDLLI